MENLAYLNHGDYAMNKRVEEYNKPYKPSGERLREEIDARQAECSRKAAPQERKEDETIFLAKTAGN